MWPFTRKPAPPPDTRATPSERVLAVTVVGQAVWALVDYRSFVAQAYSRNPIVYRSIQLIAQMAAATPLLVNGNSLDEVTGREARLALALSAPSPTMSGPDLLEVIARDDRLAGEAFLEGMEMRGDLVEIAVMRPDYVKVIPAVDGSVARYEFDPGTGKVDYPVPLPGGRGEAAFSRVCHIRQFHPTDQWRGHSPMLAAAPSVMEHNGTADYARGLLKNSARPSGALVYAPRDSDVSAKLTDEQFERLKQELTDNHTGAANAGRPLLLDGGLSWVPMSMTPTEIGAAETRATAAREIALALGVPPLLLGLPGDNTYANYREANVALWRQTVQPMLKRAAARMSKWVQPLYPGARITVDLENAPIAEEERLARFETAKAADFLTIDERRAMVGYPELPDDLGKQVLVSGSMTTLEDVLAADLGAYGPDNAQDMPT